MNRVADRPVMAAMVEMRLFLVKKFLTIGILAVPIIQAIQNNI